MECNLVWNHTRDFKIEITSMISNENCTTRSSIATLLHPFWNGNTRNPLTSHFENMSTYVNDDVIASCDWLFCFTILFSLVEKNMRFRAKNLWISRTAESQSDCKEKQSFQNEFNKGDLFTFFYTSKTSIWKFDSVFQFMLNVSSTRYIHLFQAWSLEMSSQSKSSWSCQVWIISLAKKFRKDLNCKYHCTKIRSSKDCTCTDDRVNQLSRR